MSSTESHALRRFCALGHYYNMFVSQAIHGSYEFDRIVYHDSHALRTKNIHRVLHFGALL